MNKWMVFVMMFVVISVFWKGVEVLGPSNTNYTIIYEGPDTSTEERWRKARNETGGKDE